MSMLLLSNSAHVCAQNAGHRCKIPHPSPTRIETAKLKTISFGPMSNSKNSVGLPKQSNTPVPWDGWMGRGFFLMCPPRCRNSARRRTGCCTARGPACSRPGAPSIAGDRSSCLLFFVYTKPSRRMRQVAGWACQLKWRTEQILIL